MSQLDLQKFFQASNPSRTLAVENIDDAKYYIDFSSVRGGEIIEEIGDIITLLSPDQPTCQLFTGHIGCGKSTELLRLKANLQQKGFHVVYFESHEDLEMADVDTSDILLAIASQVSESLGNIQISVPTEGFKSLLQEMKNLVEANIPGDSWSSIVAEEPLLLAQEIRNISVRARRNTQIHEHLKEYLGTRIGRLLELINKELLEPATVELKQQRREGLVVIVDNLDRVADSPKPWGRRQPEYLFVDQGEKLNQLHCHLVFTIPLRLIFSPEQGRLADCFKVAPKILPMIPVKLRDGSRCEEGMRLLQQMVLARAFPEFDEAQRLSKITEVFDSSETLEHLCYISGGHVRNLLRLLYSCITNEKQLPLSSDALEEAIMEQRHPMILASRQLSSNDWDLLRQIARAKRINGEESYQHLMRGMYIFEYRDQRGSWFDLNPLLEVAEELQEKIAIIPELSELEKPHPTKDISIPTEKQQDHQFSQICGFDVLLCHSFEDKPAVKEIGLKLKARGITTWLDEWELRPGITWQHAMKSQINNIRSVAVFVGKSGLIPWNNLEVKALLREFVKRKIPTIPVILQDVENVPDLPIFLEEINWVDFRKTEPDPLESLIWGIRGEKLS